MNEAEYNETVRQAMNHHVDFLKHPLEQLALTHVKMNQLKSQGKLSGDNFELYQRLREVEIHQQSHLIHLILNLH